jgi:hypothetical protein
MRQLKSGHNFGARPYGSVLRVDIRLQNRLPATEVALFVLADREPDVGKETELFYKGERSRWSERLQHALHTLLPE